MSSVIHPIKSVLHDVLGCVSRANRLGRTTGVPTGIKAYDELTGGLHDRELTLFAGHTEAPATTLALRIAVHVASLGPDHEYGRVRPQWSVLVCSPGTVRRELVARMVCDGAAVPSSKLGTCALEREDWRRLTDRVGELAGLGMWLDDTPGLAARDIRARAAEIDPEPAADAPVSDEQVRHLALIVVDGCHRMRGGRRALRQLKALANELCVPILATSALQPIYRVRTDLGPPSVSDVLLTEDDVDNLCFVRGDPAYEREVEVVIGRQRNGPTATVNVASPSLRQDVRDSDAAEGDDHDERRLDPVELEEAGGGSCP